MAERHSCLTCRWLEPGTHQWRRCEYPVSTIATPSAYEVRVVQPSISVLHPLVECRTYLLSYDSKNWPRTESRSAPAEVRP